MRIFPILEAWSRTELMLSYLSNRITSFAKAIQRSHAGSSFEGGSVNLHVRPAEDSCERCCGTITQSTHACLRDRQKVTWRQCTERSGHSHLGCQPHVAQRAVLCVSAQPRFILVRKSNIRQSVAYNTTITLRTGLVTSGCTSIE